MKYLTKGRKVLEKGNKKGKIQIGNSQKKYKNFQIVYTNVFTVLLIREMLSKTRGKFTFAQESYM